MITADHHYSLDDPPHIPGIIGVTPKRKRGSAVAEAIITLAGVMKTSDNKGSNTTGTQQQVAMATYSPGKISELRLKNLQELQELQELLEYNILSPEEFAKQKALVLSAMRKLIPQ